MSYYSKQHLDNMKREGLIAYCLQLQDMNQRLAEKNAYLIEAAKPTPTLASIKAELEASQASCKRHRNKIAQQARDLHSAQVEINRLTNIAAKVVAKTVLRKTA